ncbi:hypothetical protein C8T65DRAFT_702159 [Cerioporus squamosus]|nr:hypothetical protein C8T65DRAFT_702159 [Cerioporus squamosus]
MPAEMEIIRSYHATRRPQNKTVRDATYIQGDQTWCIIHDAEGEPLRIRFGAFACLTSTTIATDSKSTNQATADATTQSPPHRSHQLVQVAPRPAMDCMDSAPHNVTTFSTTQECQSNQPIPGDLVAVVSGDMHSLVATPHGDADEGKGVMSAQQQKTVVHRSLNDELTTVGSNSHLPDPAPEVFSVGIFGMMDCPCC